MKFTLSVEGDFYEDYEEIKNLVLYKEMGKAIYETRQAIVQRLKHCEDMPIEQAVVLEHLLEYLYVEGLSI